MRILFGVAILILLASCGENDTPAKPVVPPASGMPSETDAALLKSARLEPFSSTAAFDGYLTALREKIGREMPTKSAGTDAVEAGAPQAAPQADASAADSITNNQESGVDEGGIVKNAGDYLIVLRRGRLFSIHTGNIDDPKLEPTDAVDAFPENHSTKTWYDELLVYQNKIIVIGYSYGYEATEIGQFELAANGKIHHQATNFLRSHDYYSSRNYASRLIDNKLVIYMPYYFLNRYRQDEPISLPGQALLSPNGKASDWEDIIDVSTILKPVEETLDPVLHTIVTCDLAVEALACNATGLIGSSSRNFYVSPSSVYLWTSDKGESHVYRMPLNGTTPTVMRARGVPTDQFSFKESDDGFLHVLLRDQGHGDAMWSPEARDGGVSLLSIPLIRMSEEPSQAANTDYAILPEIDGYTMQNRFIGNYVLYGAENLWRSPATTNINLYNVASKQTTTLDLGHDVQRIEPIGADALVVGSKDNDLVLSLLDLADAPQRAHQFVVKGTSQGERRSHGFFYRATADNEGILGLPTRTESEPFSELFVSSAAINFFSIKDKTLSELGGLKSTTNQDIDDACVASCVDWYGNARPIFLGQRILGLMGYDLVEANLRNGKIVEHARVNFMPHAD